MANGKGEVDAFLVRFRQFEEAVADINSFQTLGQRNGGFDAVGTGGLEAKSDLIGDGIAGAIDDCGMAGQSSVAHEGFVDILDPTGEVIEAAGGGVVVVNVFVEAKGGVGVDDFTTGVEIGDGVDEATREIDFHAVVR